jgi:cobalt-precorrin-5B (C1)-methyltransferase
MDKNGERSEGNYVTVNGRRMRCGHTTGTCAAAASKASALALLSGGFSESVEILTPKGILLDLEVENGSMSDVAASCAVRKDGGDDQDATHGTLVFSEVRLTASGIDIDGGKGVGRVTRKGLDQPPGNAAINKVPRSMIREALEDVAMSFGYKGGFSVTISVPEGEEIAVRTFNPRLGIQGGISILGTSGIVEPMSEKALIASIEKEMDVHAAAGEKVLIVVPGNYGKEFSDSIPGIDDGMCVKCSNFVGEMLDHACELGVDVVLISNMGKLVKVAGGIMNTHSRNADCRMEIIASNAAVAGADIGTVRKVMECISTDDALDALTDPGLLEKTCGLMMDKIQYHMNHRTYGKIRTGAVMFSSTYGLLGKTELADELIKEATGQ